MVGHRGIAAPPVRAGAGEVLEQPGGVGAPVVVTVDPLASDRPLIIRATTVAPSAIKALRHEQVQGLSRRELLRGSLAAGIGVWLLESAAGTIGFIWPNLAGGFGGKITLGKYSDLKTQHSTIPFDQGFPAYYADARAFVVLVDPAKQYEPKEAAALVKKTAAGEFTGVYLTANYPGPWIDEAEVAAFERVDMFANQQQQAVSAIEIAAVEADGDRHLVPAQGVRLPGVVGRAVEGALVPRPLVVLEDLFLVHVVRCGHLREHLVDLPEPGHEAVRVLGVVVHVEAGTGRRVDVEQAHQRLGAVVAGAHAHVALVEHLAEVVRVNVAERETQRGTSQRGISRAVEGDVVAEPFGERAKRVGGEVEFVCANVGHSETLQEVDCCTEAHHLHDGWRARFELGRQRSGGEIGRASCRERV